MKGFIRVVDAMPGLPNTPSVGLLLQHPEQMYIPLSDIIFIKVFPTAETPMRDTTRIKITTCLSTSDDPVAHLSGCNGASCICYENGIPAKLYPLIVIVCAKTGHQEEFLVYPDEENRRLLREGETSEQTELLRQMLLELQYGSAVGSGYTAAHKRFRLNSDTLL